MSEMMRRPHRYVVSGDPGRVFSDPAYKLRHLETIRACLRRIWPDFQATVTSTPTGYNYKYTIAMTSPESVDVSLLESIRADLGRQGIDIVFVQDREG